MLLLQQLIHNDKMHLKTARAELYKQKTRVRRSPGKYGVLVPAGIITERA